MLWANLHLLFWLSLVPFTTAWMDEHFGTTPVMVYGVNLLLAALAYYVLQLSVERADGPCQPAAAGARPRPQGQAQPA